MAAERTLDLSRLPPPGLWPHRVTPDILPFPADAFDRAVLGLDILRASRLYQLFAEVGRVVVRGGGVELVVGDDEPADGLPELIAAMLRAFDVRSIAADDGRLAIRARNEPAGRDGPAAEAADPVADTAAALLCRLREDDRTRESDRDRDNGRTRDGGRDREYGRDKNNGRDRSWRVEVGDGDGRATAVRFAPAALPATPPRRPGLRVAAILGERARAVLRYEFELTPVGPDSWRTAFRPGPPNLLLVEPALPVAPCIPDLLEHCRIHAVPTLFWNTADPAGYETFLPLARRFDRVFTVDASCVDRYRRDLGHDRVTFLPFAIQPRIHNPVGSFSDGAGDIAYVATDGREPPDDLLAAAAGLGLHILGTEKSGPTSPGHRAVGPLTYKQLLSAYRRYRVVLHADPAPDSATRVPPEVLEALACGTPVVTGPSAAVTGLPGPVGVGIGAGSVRLLLKALLGSPELRDRRAVQGIRAVMRYHSCVKSVDEFLRTAGLSMPPRPVPRVSVVAPTHRPGGYEGILASAGRQTHPDVELVLGLHGVDEPESRIRDAAAAHGIHDLTIVRLPGGLSLGSVCNELIRAASGTYVARMDDDDFYGPHYLEDQLRAFDYTEADVVGKWTRFILLESVPALGVIFPGTEHVYGTPLCGGTLMMRRELCDEVRFADLTRGEDSRFVIDCAQRGFATYATDRFNYVYVRHADASRHTYRPDDLELLSQTRIVSFGPSYEHAFA